MTRINLIIVCLFFSACSLQPEPASPAISWQEHRQQVAALQQWQLSGKLGYRGPEKGGSAKLNWTQDEDHYQLLFSGPLGMGSAEIVGNSKTVEMAQGDAVYRAAPEYLAVRLTGLPIPVDALGWWVRGLPSPNQPKVTDLATGADGLASGFSQGGWQLSFSRYRMTQGGMLPGKISGTFNTANTAAHSATATNRRYSFKLVISHWNFQIK